MGLLQDKLAKYTLPQKYKALGIYPYFREIEGGYRGDYGRTPRLDVRFQRLYRPYR